MTIKKDLLLPPPDDALEYLAAIIDSTDDAIISKDLKGNITSWNPAAERMFGYTADEVNGKHITLLIPQDRLSEEDYILGEISKGNRIDHFETMRRTKDGHCLNLAVTVSPIRNKKGVIIGASKVARDITELKKAERSNAYLGAIIESSDDAIISKDLNGFITSWNKSAERIFGYASDEIVGRHITILIPADRLKEEDLILSTLRDGKRIEHFETVRRHKDGQLVPVSLTVSPIRDSTGAIIGASKVSRDISQRVEAENMIAEMSSKKDEFIANMSHELRTPMNAVIGLANLLSRDKSLSVTSKKMVDTLKLSADNLLSLINDLLDFAKIEAGGIQLDEVEFDLAEQIERVLSVTNVMAREKSLRLFINYGSDVNRRYVGDPLRLQQILMNLVSNAIKFTSEGQVEVEIEGVADASTNMTLLTIRVIDTGIGIPKEKLSNIFEKFVQADSSVSRRFGGSGLGLTITKSLVEKMGGTISVESELGVGSTFTVTLLLKNNGESSPIKSFTAHAKGQRPKITKDVLLVEDYEPNALVGSLMLEDLGYTYEIASNGFDALRKFVHGTYKLILMDVQMHEMDGLEATRRIRQIEPEKGLPRIPIVAMTAHVGERDKAKCFDAGMDDFIPKPFDPAELAQKLARLIDKHSDSDPGSPSLLAPDKTEITF